MYYHTLGIISACAGMLKHAALLYLTDADIAPILVSLGELQQKVKDRYDHWTGSQRG